MKNLEIKLCPFCGAAPEIEDDVYFDVACSNEDCCIGLNRYETKELAIQAWNTRFPPQGPLVIKDGNPMPIYPVPDDNLYKVSYKYVENDMHVRIEYALSKLMFIAEECEKYQWEINQVIRVLERKTP